MFDAVVLSHAIGVRKPRPGFFHHCQELAGCPAAECLFIDDLAVNIEGARSAGLQGIVYTPQGNFAEELEKKGVTSEE